MFRTISTLAVTCILWSGSLAAQDKAALAVPELEPGFACCSTAKAGGLGGQRKWFRVEEKSVVRR